MSKFFKKALISSLSVSLLGLAWGCGSTSSNDQGVSVQNLGYFVVGSDEDPPPGITGAILPLSSDVALISEVNDFFPGQGTAISATPLVDGLTHFASMGVFNRMQQQFFRVSRIDCTYDVPGASISIPSDSSNVSFIVNASVFPAGDPIGDVVDEAQDALPNIVYAPFQILSPDLYAFLNVNKASLPELPFRMTASCRAVGVTEAGDTLETNDMFYQIQFVEFTECCTGSAGFVPGFQQGPGTGGSTEGSIVSGGSGTGSITSGSSSTDSSSSADSAAGSGT